MKKKIPQKPWTEKYMAEKSTRKRKRNNSREKKWKNKAMWKKTLTKNTRIYIAKEISHFTGRQPHNIIIRHKENYTIEKTPKYTLIHTLVSIQQMEWSKQTLTHTLKEIHIKKKVISIHKITLKKLAQQFKKQQSLAKITVLRQRQTIAQYIQPH